MLLAIQATILPTFSSTRLPSYKLISITLNNINKVIISANAKFAIIWKRTCCNFLLHIINIKIIAFTVIGKTEPVKNKEINMVLITVFVDLFFYNLVENTVAGSRG